ncbi:SDR family NAD(P)-dependent oxidoreductase [Neolewinella lacunae]|uniref:SDR family NAD(P)-dependent oxidoreductase n=1 Tax=Neolewinella lacunae TaxID=1517758 RepID=A0A923PLE2_9BACT|nr:SDR family NAD(P)-dependent oxidoreductase [Neolewinella lacunae]MBC6996227.1 SDR family NAD(P)-dependent oxidoreductase [Neolewinella lacunae]MDN3634753.1 SDR family NAD(P)-dependent oxidoreductase [Neolewinella lacunae]
MLSIALAYCSDDQSAAQRIGGDLASHVNFNHLSVGRSNAGPVLADLAGDYDGRIVLLVSESFLTNPNCMLRATEILGSNRDVLPVYLRNHRYDEELGEVITTQTSLSKQSDLMHYINHWQDRYIDLRQQQDELGSHGGEEFQRYLRKIRETSVQMEEILILLRDAWTLTESQFAANHYQQLFIFADRPALWEEYRAFETAPPLDVAGIPGLDMLRAHTPEAEPTPPLEEDAGAGAQVPGEVERPGPPDPEPEPMIETTPELDLPPAPGIAPEVDSTEQAETWISRAWALFDGGDAGAALELLDSGREALPDQLDLHYHYALLLATSTEDHAAARRETEALLDRSPDHPDALFLGGELCEVAGDYATAREYWEQLSDVEPFYPDLNYRLGILLADHFPEDALDAAAYLRRASRNKKPHAEACYRYALLLKSPIGRKKKAIRQLRRAVELDPTHALAHYELATLLHGQKKYAAARNAFHLAVALEPAFDTEVNRHAFAKQPKKTVVAATPAEEQALQTLKRNIAELEALIAERDLAPSPDPAPAAAPQTKKPGTNKTVLISGATSGIGRATALRLAREGYRLILLGRRQQRLEELAALLLEDHGTETLLLALDIRDRSQLHHAIAQLPEEWSAIDILINNAGKAKGVDPIHEGQIEHWEEMIDVNLKGLLYLTRAVTPGMVARQTGMVLNVASTAGKEVYPNGNVYCATKHAVDALTYAMRLDLVKHGIRVGQICPAMVEETEFSLVRYDGDAERAKIYEDFQPLRSRDVAEAIHFMVSQPPHVNVIDLVLQGTQQASSTVVDRSGRERFAPVDEEE